MFKVGDRVKIVKSSVAHSHIVGSTGVVESIYYYYLGSDRHIQYPIVVQFDEGYEWKVPKDFASDELELLRDNTPLPLPG